MTFRAGDHVRVASINESWLLACDEEHGRVTCAGWPEGSVEAEKCTLERAATDEERIKMLENVARQCRGEWRGRSARAQLEKERTWQCSVWKAGDAPGGIAAYGAFPEDAAHSVALATALIGGWINTTRITVEVEASHGHEAQRYEFDCRVVPQVTRVMPANTDPTEEVSGG